LVTRDVVLFAAAVGFAISLAPVSAAAKFDAKEANKICTERYNVEKAGGTVPAGMPKSKYVGQCTRAMKRNAEIEADLAEQLQGTETEESGGNNEITATTQHATSSSQPTKKPAGVTTPAFTAATKGN
jgi:hypothetical protein